MKQLKFYSDRGHDDVSGKDPGAVNGDLREGTMTIVTAQAFHDRIMQHGHLSKLESGNLSINESAKAANAWEADYCISWHYNAGGGDRGEVIYSWEDAAVKLAGVVANGLKAAGQGTVKVYKSKANSAGTAEYFGMLRIPTMPAIIIEPCFIDNASDRTLADTEAEQRRIGICIADALAEAYGSTLNDNAAYFKALDVLVYDNVIKTVEYWQNAATNNTDVNGEYMATVIMRMTNKSTLVAGVAALVSSGAISTPDYWLANAITGKTCKIDYVKKLIVNGVEKLQL